MSHSSFGDLLGFVGALILLAGFAWGTLRNAAPDLPYHLSNLVGAAFLATSLTINFNLPALCLEVAWGVLALLGLIRMMLAKRV